MSVDQASTWAPAEIVAVAKWERYVIFLILLELLSEVAFLAMAMVPRNSGSDAAISVIALLVLVGRVVVLALCIYGVYKMASVLRKRAAAVYAVCMFLPLVGLIVLLTLNSAAMDVLKAQGIKIGLMGANRDDVERYANQAGVGAPLT